MKTTQNLEMKIPEGGDPIDITDITGNFEKLDTEIAKKANASGGDISAMAVKTLDTIATEFPVPSAGESSKTFLGKVRKFVQDFNNFKTGILTLGRLVNNGQTTEPGFALDARYGRTLYELYAQLNADLGNLYSNLNEVQGDVSNLSARMPNEKTLLLAYGIAQTILAKNATESADYGTDLYDKNYKSGIGTALRITDGKLRLIKIMPDGTETYQDVAQL